MNWSAFGYRKVKLYTQEEQFKTGQDIFLQRHGTCRQSACSCILFLSISCPLRHLVRRVALGRTLTTHTKANEPKYIFKNEARKVHIVLLDVRPGLSRYVYVPQERICMSKGLRIRRLSPHELPEGCRLPKRTRGNLCWAWVLSAESLACSLEGSGVELRDPPRNQNHMCMWFRRRQKIFLVVAVWHHFARSSQIVIDDKWR